MNKLAEAEIDTLEAGRPLDALIAEHVMEWHKRRGPAYDYDGPCEAHDILVPPQMTLAEIDDGYIWPPRGVIKPWYFCKPWSNDLASAFAVAQHMAERLFRRVKGEPGYLDDTELNSLTLAQCSSLPSEGTWFAAFQVFDPWPEDFEPEHIRGLRAVALASTPMLAICRAALKAVML